jgi:hypothetical protein
MPPKVHLAALALAAGAAFFPISTAATPPQAVPLSSLDDVPDARIAVSALHGPIRLSTLRGFPERSVILGNVNAQDWSPGGDRLVYVDDRGNGEYALSVTDTLGGTLQLPVPARSTWPQYSRDGRWIYFFTQDDHPPHVYRIAPDGTDLQPLMPGAFPAPHPDGSRIAITVGAGVWVGDPLARVGSVVPGSPPSAIATRWSPDGLWLAYRDRRGGGITIVRPDGTGRRMIPAPPIGGLSWSPDGTWLLGGNVDGGPLQLIDTRTDEARWLPEEGVYPAWRPDVTLLLVGRPVQGEAIGPDPASRPDRTVAGAWPRDRPAPPSREPPQNRDDVILMSARSQARSKSAFDASASVFLPCARSAFSSPKCDHPLSGCCSRSAR